jgi:hypothetical protein
MGMDGMRRYPKAFSDQLFAQIVSDQLNNFAFAARQPQYGGDVLPFAARKQPACASMKVKFGFFLTPFQHEVQPVYIGGEIGIVGATWLARGGGSQVAITIAKHTA